MLSAEVSNSAEHPKCMYVIILLSDSFLNLSTLSTSQRRDRAGARPRQQRGQAARPHCTGRTCTSEESRLYWTFENGLVKRTLTDLTMLSANSSARVSASGLVFPLNEAALARAELDLAAMGAWAGDLVRLLDRADRTMDLCGLCGIFRVVLQILSMNPKQWQCEHRKM